MRTYEYDPVIYKRKITFTGVFCTLVLLYSVYNLLLVQDITAAIWIVAGVVSFYTVWETFVSIANPGKVTADEEGIAFSAYGREHRFAWSEIKEFRVKEFVSARKLFLRINKAGIFRGRYWLHCQYFDKGEELYKFIVDKEYELHPDSLKARARAQGEIDMAERREKRKIKQRELAMRRGEEALAKEIKRSSGKKGK